MAGDAPDAISMPFMTLEMILQVELIPVREQEDEPRASSRELN